MNPGFPDETWAEGWSRRNIASMAGKSPIAAASKVLADLPKNQEFEPRRHAGSAPGSAEVCGFGVDSRLHAARKDVRVCRVGAFPATGPAWQEHEAMAQRAHRADKYDRESSYD